MLSHFDADQAFNTRSFYRRYLPLVLAALLLTGCVTIPENVKRGDTLFTEKDYAAALRAYQLGLPEITDAEQRQVVAGKIDLVKQVMVDQHIEAAKQIHARTVPATTASINDVINYLKNVPFDDAQGRIAALIAAYEEEKLRLRDQAGQTIIQALDAARDYQFDQAGDLLAQAGAIDPDGQALLDAKASVLDREQRYLLVERHLENGVLDQAREAYFALVGPDADNNALNRFPLKDRFEELVMARVTELTQANRWNEANKLLEDWPDDMFESQRAEIMKTGSRYYLKAAQESVAFEENHHKGLVYALKAMVLDPKDIDIFNIHKETQDQVNQSMQRYIAVASFDSPSNDPDSGKQFSDSLISYLYQVLPYGINILERDKIDFVLNEQKSEAKSLGEILGVDLMVTGTVSLYRVEQSIDKRTASVKVKTGTDTIENPEFAQMVYMFGADLSQWPKKMKKAYGEDTSTWPPMPSKTLEKDVFQMISYNKGTAIKKGFAKVSVRIFDTEKGTITFVRDFDATVVKSSEFQDELKAANIPYIPMNLPTDTEIKEEMRKSIVTQVAQIVQSSFENREWRFLNQAQFYLDRLEHAAALKPLAEGHLYAIRDNLEPDNEAFSKIRSLIDEMVARSDLLPQKPLPPPEPVLTPAAAQSGYESLLDTDETIEAYPDTESALDQNEDDLGAESPEGAEPASPAVENIWSPKR